MNAQFKAFQRVAAVNRVVFFFSGYFTQGVIAASTETIRARLASSRANPATQRRLVSAFVELSQNVIHYSGDTATAEDAVDDEMRFGTMCISALDDHFEIMCTNPVNRNDAARLESKLALLRDMSVDQIRDAYRRTLREDDGDAGSNGSKGAGLGLLTMARDAVQPINFLVEHDPSWGDDFRVFYLKVTI